jgi:hypothetical protein
MSAAWVSSAMPFELVAILAISGGTGYVKPLHGCARQGAGMNGSDMSKVLVQKGLDRPSDQRDRTRSRELAHIQQAS